MALESVRKGDIVCVLLGTNLPTILRPNLPGTTFSIIGHCYIHGLMHGEALLGPVPKPWVAKRRMNWRGGHEACSEHTMSEEVVDMTEDPHLYSGSDDWERLENDDPHRIQKWKNHETGEVVNSDPRLSPDALIERGVKLEMFTLV
ncbi:hypothetical protein BDZ45DRAFT_738690 [Acephala macrosclerotiorum]|nr:hypothetical protein BDZ45DRAFT_738690 [Acephala macrosclerotiorum]